MGRFVVGFDVGSDSVHSIVLDKEDKIIMAPHSRMHFGNPVEVVQDEYREIINQIGFINIQSVAFTGSVGKFIAEKTNSAFFYDTLTIPNGLKIVAPDADYAFHVGAKDPYYFLQEKIKTKDGWKTFIPDHGTGTKCGGGSGILITKQCRRFFEHNFPVTMGDDRRINRKILQEQLEKIFQISEEESTKSEKDIDVGGRCGVVIQSDMIHLQNSGEQIKNILNGMYRRVAKNYKSDVLKTRVIDGHKKAVATGGIFFNRSLAKIFEEIIGVTIIIPENFEKVGAIGAALKAREESGKFEPEVLNNIIQKEKEKIKMAASLSSALEKVVIYDEEEKFAKIEDLVIYKKFEENEKINVLIGLDGGSTTTKAIVADSADLKILAEICLYTNGKPLQTAQELFRQLKANIGKNINIKGIAYTGSSGAFYFKLFTDLKKNADKKCLDIIKDEITCHAYGVKHYNKEVDTIFELGGQDAKFTLFNKDGTVKKSKMNLSCMAGTGQTMHNMVEMIGLDIKTNFHEYALNAKFTPMVDETCGVFTEAGIAKLIAMGFEREEIAAAIVFGFMGGYVNKFVGNEKFGNYASAQGGPFNGKSCLAALALHTGMEIHAFPHRQLFGALGAVIALKKRMKRMEREGIEYETKFRGLKIADTTFEKKIESCRKIVSDNCGLRDCKLQVYKIGNDIIYSGGLCPKGSTESTSKKAPNYVENYKRILNRHLEKYTTDLSKHGNQEKILIPRTLSFLNEKGVFYVSLYKNLGFDISISPESDDEIANLGLNSAHSETCYPIKLAHGHAAYLKKYLVKKRDKILLVNTIAAGKERYKFCPYVAAEGFLVKDALEIDNQDVLLPVVHFDNPVYRIEEYLKKDLERAYGRSFDIRKIRDAVKKAKISEQIFLDDIYDTGEKIIESLKKKKEKIFIGIGRGYTVLDNKASSKVHELFAANGLHFIPALFIKEPSYNVDEFVENMYWFQGRKMIKYNLMVAIDPDFYPVRETNFNCGTDSFILYHEIDIINQSGKPYLLLQTDGHNSNAQFGTRTLANYEVVKKHQPKKMELNDFAKKFPLVDFKKRIIGIPYMGDSANILAAGFRSLGLKSEVIETHTIKSQEMARKLITHNTCKPFSFQVGDTLAWLTNLKERGIDANSSAAIFEPKAAGPCRFGQYSVMLRKFFDENGFNNVPVISPDAAQDYNDIPLPKRKLVKLLQLCLRGFICSDILFDALLRARPYEKEKGGVENEYNLLREKLYLLVEKSSPTSKFVSFMKLAAKRLEKITDKSMKRNPLVLLSGEIFVRCHSKANQDSVRLLEKYKLEVVMASPSQWIEYVNKSSIEYYKKSNDWKKLLLSLLKKEYMKRLNKKLYSPFKTFLLGREPHDPKHAIDAAQKALIYEKLINGESPLSVGEAQLFSRGELKNICGIYHIGPFGCMHETAATSQIQALIQKKRKKSEKMEEKIIPFMDAVFGESELSNLEAEVATFAEKCYIKQDLIGDKINSD
jgi:activator of 2-hydroxyglutaryl-CoA dehydratase/predicted nucleotide-binding protein (sugar kinase/HSP70/actin superfamily)